MRPCAVRQRARPRPGRTSWTPPHPCDDERVASVPPARPPPRLNVGLTPPFRCGGRGHHHFTLRSTCHVGVVSDSPLPPVRCDARRSVEADGAGGGRVVVITSPIASFGTVFAGTEVLSPAAASTVALTPPPPHPLGSRRRLHRHRRRHARTTCRPHASNWLSC